MTTTATNIQNRIDFLKNQLLINTIVRRIHEEWLAKFRLSGKITLREVKQLGKRLEAQGFKFTYVLEQTSYHTKVFLNDEQIDWFNLYFNNNSLENTIQTIDSQVKIIQARIATLLSEQRNIDTLSTIEPAATALCEQIETLIQTFMDETMFTFVSSTSRETMPDAKLLEKFFEMLHTNRW